MTDHWSTKTAPPVAPPASHAEPPPIAGEGDEAWIVDEPPGESFPRQARRKQNCGDNVAIHHDSDLVVECDGTYGEGGGYVLPLDVVRWLLDAVGLKIVPKD